jgi:hypothetical protein
MEVLEMKKSNLKTGYRVTLRNGDSYICLIGTDTDYFSGDVLVDPKAKSHNWINLSEYDNKMNIKDDFREYDIMMVEKPSHLYDILWHFEGFTIIWEREE